MVTDFIFGTLDTNALKQYRHNLLHRGLRHGHEMEPRRPRANEAITLTVTTGVDFTADTVIAYVTTDGSQPHGRRGHAANGDVFPFRPVATIWDTLSWGYVTRWQAELPGYAAGTLLRYRIGAFSAETDERFADFPDVKQSGEMALQYYLRHSALPEFDQSYGDSRQPTTFALSIAQAGTPVWAHDAIIYHVFVDRFYPGDGDSWQQPADLLGFYGGTLRGVVDKLDYIADLGANCIWLSPIAPSPSHHGYDVTDYRDVEPRLGTRQDLRTLVDGAHERGMRVLLDMVCNHLSVEHPLFVEAQNDPASRYRDWFYFDEPELGYRSFLGTWAMPQLNLENSETRDWMIANALYWLREFDVDGFRLDHANGPGPDFWTHFNRACKGEKVNCFCFGEVIDTPDLLAAYVGRLDGVLDFQLNEALRKRFGWQTQTQADFERFKERHADFFPADFVMPAFLDNHDMDRFMRIADNDKSVLLEALRALLQLPNPPVIYYGTEIGLTQSGSANQGLHTNRVPMRWGDEQDKQLLERTRALIRSRRDGDL